MIFYKKRGVNFRFLFCFFCVVLAPSAPAESSTCFGTTKAGRLEGGVRLPSEGKNFQAYSRVGVMAGRTYVHSQVQAIVVQAYAALEKTAPGKVFVYGETGFEEGGRFRPHKTHQNGLSVDFMVPVVKQGASVPLPTSALNKFGYEIEFDDRGRAQVGGEEYAIDFEALAQHLVEIHKAAQASDVTIWRVIFEVPLQRHLFATRHGDYLKQHLKFSTKPAGVRHDEHYHIDFEIPCKPLVE